MKAFRKTVSSWAHKKEGMILLHRKQRLFLKAKEDLTAEEEQARAAEEAKFGDAYRDYKRRTWF